MTEKNLTPLSKQAVMLIDHLGIKFADPEQLSLKIAERLAFAPTAEDLFSDSETIGWDELEGVPITVRSIDWIRSSFTEGIGFFAVVEGARADTGEKVIVTTGSTNVVMQLARAAKEGWLDKPLVLVKSRTATADGFYPQRLKLA